MLLFIDSKHDVPIYQQIYQQIIIGIAKHELVVGEQLPTVRQMADEIGVNMMTVSKAYTLLKNEGYILADRRKGTIVAERHPFSKTFDQQFSQELEFILSRAYIHKQSKQSVIEKVEQFYQNFKQ